VADEQTLAVEDDYDVTTCALSALSAEEIERCLDIVTDGGAVNAVSARQELVRSQVLAVVRKGGVIVGVGAIKRIRRGYASSTAKKSGVLFRPETPELGYVARHRDCRGTNLSPRIVAALLSAHKGPLFATTDHNTMKETLARAGFVQHGKEWTGQRSMLSLWMRG